MFFMLFLYRNPEGMLAKNAKELEAQIPKFKEVYYMWASMVLGVAAILMYLYVNYW